MTSAASLQTTVAKPMRAASATVSLQRKCACGGAASMLTGECQECKKKMAGQTKLRINEPGDAYEQEASRVADRVIKKPARADVSSSPPRIRRFAGQSNAPTDAAPPASVEHALADAGKPLDRALRQDMELRFGHDFSRVRVHLGPGADQSTEDLNANAYAAGDHIVFGAGQYAPETQAGRHLIAHELTHVVQQSPILIRRQPKDQPKEQPQKTLKSEGVDVKDPVAAGTAGIIDEVLARNTRLAPYIGDKLKGGFRIAAKGKFIVDTTDGNFDDAFRKAYKLSSADSVAKATKGFFDPKKSEIHLRPGAEFGTALHESVHRLASPGLYGTYLPAAYAISEDLGDVLKEGVTAFFTDTILKDEGLTKFIDAYARKKKKAEALIAALGADGFDLLAKFNFQGRITEIGERWGIDSNQYGGDRVKFIRNVLKRMKQAI